MFDIVFSMRSVQNSVYYCCLSKGNRVLYEFSSGDGEIERLAVLCLEKAPLYHRWYFQTMGKRTFGFLMEEGCIYFAIADVGLGKQRLLHFLENIRHEFGQMNKGLRKSMSIFDSLRLQEQLVPVIRHMISTLGKVSESTDCLTETPSPPAQSEAAASTKSPLLGRSSKIDKKKMREHAIAMREIQLEEHRRSTDRVIKMNSENLESDRLDASVSSLSRRDSACIRSSNSNFLRKYWRQVQIVLAIDAFICLLLFVIWLLICGGTRCT